MKETSGFTKTHEIDWKHQSNVKNKDYAIYVPYVNARALMNWLDETFDTWDKTTEWLGMIEHDQEKYDKVTRLAIIKTTRHNLFRCTITVKKDGEIQTVDDMAEPTDIEPVKGGASDSFKRAGSNLGFGRDLYKYPTVFVQIDEKYSQNFKKGPALAFITELYISGTVSNDDTLFVDLNGTLSHFAYGKPDPKRVLYPKGGKVAAPKKAAAPKKDAGPTKITLDAIRAKLYGGNGELKKALEDPVLVSWEENDKKIYFKKYIPAFNKMVGEVQWFELNNYQLTKFQAIANG